MGNCPNTVFHANLEEGIETGICHICRNKTTNIRKSATAIKIISGPDNMGRYVYIAYWYDPTPPYCGICGADPSRNCGHYGPHTRAQIFNAKLKGDINGLESH